MFIYMIYYVYLQIYQIFTLSKANSFIASSSVKMLLLWKFPTFYHALNFKISPCFCIKIVNIWNIIILQLSQNYHELLKPMKEHLIVKLCYQFSLSNISTQPPYYYRNNGCIWKIWNLSYWKSLVTIRQFMLNLFLVPVSFLFTFIFIGFSIKFSGARLVMKNYGTFSWIKVDTRLTSNDTWVKYPAIWDGSFYSIIEIQFSWFSQ